MQIIRNKEVTRLTINAEGRKSSGVTRSGNLMDPSPSDAPLTFRQQVAGIAGTAGLCALALLWPVLGNTAAYLALVLLLAGALIGWRNEDIRALSQRKWVRAYWLGFGLLTLAFLVQGDVPGMAAIGDFLIFALAPLYALALAPARKWLTLSRLSWLCALSAAVAAAVGLWGMWQGQERVTALSLSPIHFADFAVILGFMALAGTLGRRELGWPLLWAGPLLAVVATVAASTRGALLTALILAAIYGIMAMRGMTGRARWMLPLGLIGAVLLVFGAAHALGFTRPLEALDPIIALLQGKLPSDTSALFRVEMYHGGLGAFLDRPLFGHGWHDQLAASLPYMSDVGRDGYALEGWGYIHNDAMSFAVGAGLLGVLAYVLFLLAPVFAQSETGGHADGDARLYLVLALVVGLFASGMTDALFMVEIPKLLLVTIAAAMAPLNGRAA